MSSPDSSSTQRRANRARVVRALRERGALSRGALAEIGLSRSTVDERGRGADGRRHGRRGRRRPRTPATPAGRRRWSGSSGDLGVAVGVEIANGVVRAAICNTAQELLAHDSVPMDDHTPPEATLKTAGTLIDHMLDRVGLPAGTGPRRRRRDARADPAPQRGQRSGHHAQAVGERQPALGRGRDPAAAAAGRQRREPGRARRAHLGRGPRACGTSPTSTRPPASASGSSSTAALYVGANGTAGELGHTTIDENGLVCECGGRGCLNTLANADAITQNLWRSHGDRLSDRGRHQAGPGRRRRAAAACSPTPAGTSAWRRPTCTTCSTPS